MIGIALANMLVGSLQDANPDTYPGTKVNRVADWILTIGIAIQTCDLASLMPLRTPLMKQAP